MHIKKLLLKYHSTLIIAGVLTLLGLSWVIPLHADFFIFQRRLQESWIVALGVAGLPVALMDAVALKAVFILAVVIPLTLAIQFFWRIGIPSRVVLAMLLIVNGFIGYSLISIGLGQGWLTSTEPDVMCELSSSETHAIRLINYTQLASDYAFGHYFFLMSDDGRQTWEQIGYAGYETGISSCHLYAAYGDTDYNYSTCKPDQENNAPTFCLMFRHR